MVMPNVHVTPIVGLPQFSGWSHVLEGTHSSPHRFVAVLAVSGNQASNVGRDTASLLLSETINSAEELHGKISAAIELCAQVDCELAIGAALVTDKKTIFAVSHASVFLRRHTKIGTILSSSGPLKLVEGSRTDDDVYALVTEQASKFLGEIELKSKQGYDVDTIITSIVPGVHAQQDSSLSAFAFVAHAVQDAETAAYPESVTTVGHISDYSIQQEVPNELADDSQKADATLTGNATVSVLQKIHSVLSWIWKVLKGFLQWLGLLLHWLYKNLISIAHIVKGVRSDRQDSSREIAYVSPVRRRRAKVFLLVSISILLVLGGVTWYWIRARTSEISRAESLVAPLKIELSVAQGLVQDQPVEARDRVQKVIRELEALLAIHSEQTRMAEIISAELTNAQQLFDSISGQEALDVLPIFYDLRLVKSDFVTTQVALAGTTALFLDAEKMQLVSLDLADKAVRSFSLSEGQKISAMAGGSDTRIFLLNGGISSLKLEADAQLEALKAEGDSTRGGTLIGTFDRFVYVFNPTKRNLYRYAEQTDGLSDPIGWLQVSRGLDYGKVTTMAIDGDIWLGTNDGNISKFTSGEEQEFSISGLPQPFDSNIYLVTGEDVESLYVLEPARNRIVILSKVGEFLREVTNQSLGAATGLLVQESTGKAFAVSGATVFEIAL